MDSRGSYTALHRVQTQERGKIIPCPECKVVDPNTSKWLTYWDMVVTILVLIIAVLAPYETAYLHPKLDVLFLFNRFVDIMFIIDMMLQFVTAAPDPNKQGHQLKSFGDIASAYIKGWFVVDILSIAPVDIILVSTGDNESTGLQSELTNLKAIRLLRLLRLCRLARLQRIMERWQTKIGMNYSIIALVQFLAMIAVASHWMACLWGGLALQREGNHNWLTALKAGKGGPEYYYTEHRNVYCSALYWALVTLTSIGYGDITPQNRDEYIVAAVCMSLLAGLWAYVIGGVCGIVATLQPHEVRFKQTMDDLNTMLDYYVVDNDERTNIRKYFHEAKNLSRERVERAVIDQMSPALQGEVAIFVHKRWISNVRFLREMPPEIFISVASCLKMMVYAPNEVFYLYRTLFIVQRGLCARKGKVLRSGESWGNDMLLENDYLRDTSVTRSLGYLHVLCLQYSDLFRMKAKIPDTRRPLLRERVRISLMRGLPTIARALTAIEKKGRSKELSKLSPLKRELLYCDICRGHFKIERLDEYFVDKEKRVSHAAVLTLETTAMLVDTLVAKMSALENVLNDLSESQEELCATVEELSPT